MKIKEFIIRNFKGIKKAKVELTGDVITLIGINESGKTTILEAISNYISTDKNTNELVNTVHKASSLQEIIPISKKAAFSDVVSIKATVELDDDDVMKLRDEYLSKHSLHLDVSAIKRTITIEKAHSFKDSEYTGNMSYWNINFPIIVKGKKARRQLGENLQKDKDEKRLWLVGVDVLRERHPKIAYFPTFLFDFPDRIYISQHSDGESVINSYYSQVFQDVLDSENSNLDINKHILDRIEKFKSGEDAAFAFSKFSSSPERRQVDAVMQKASNEMTRVIFGAWNQILGRKVAGKRIQIDWSIDSYKDNSVYLEVFIIDGELKYSISERSLGFRWFFSFLLLTQFRRNRKDGGSTIFLFDEPASNLHSKAQVKLLDSFTRISGELTKIIYSTHSHYMINPSWLEDAYIVSNEVVEIDEEYDLDSFDRGENDIISTRYRTFVGSHPSQTTYFQPVLDALDVGFSPIISSSRALIVEGKFDYFPIVYFQRVIKKREFPEIFPANGAGNAGRIISLFRGWGVKFCVLLDADKAGKTGKQKYMKEYLLSDDEVVTLGDLDQSLSESAFEALFQDDVRDSIKKHFSVDHIEKRHFSMFFQEMVNSNTYCDFPDTINKFSFVSDWLDIQFGSDAISEE